MDNRPSVFTAARGSYQRDLLHGRETWSGSSLQGAASSYGYHYAVSRRNLLDRIRGLGYDAVTELRLIDSRWRRVLIVDGAIW